MARNTITDIDRHVGGRLRQRRMALQLTQDNVGAVCGVGFRQAQKYETGASTISAAHLWRVANLLQVPVSYFFEGLGAPRAPRRDSSDA